MHIMCNDDDMLPLQGFTVAAQPINKSAAKVGSAGRTDAAAGSEHSADGKDEVKAGNQGYAERFGKFKEDGQADSPSPPKFPPTLISFKPPDYTL